ncbi:hypothetical protein [Kitasatospora sp. NPDC090308]|uniref:hypothetical protein n=1 Tax=Kitasatospora sp. NPDC090308 TaxID=3364082 RepID=UPI003804F02F
MSGHLLFLAVLVLLVVGGVDFDRDDRKPGRLRWLRVTPPRTVELWREGLSLRLVITSRN